MSSGAATARFLPGTPSACALSRKPAARIGVHSRRVRANRPTSSRISRRPESIADTPAHGRLGRRRIPGVMSLRETLQKASAVVADELQRLETGRSRWTLLREPERRKYLHRLHDALADLERIDEAAPISRPDWAAQRAHPPRTPGDHSERRAVGDPERDAAGASPPRRRRDRVRADRGRVAVAQGPDELAGPGTPSTPTAGYRPQSPSTAPAGRSTPRRSPAPATCSSPCTGSRHDTMRSHAGRGARSAPRISRSWRSCSQCRSRPSWSSTPWPPTKAATGSSSRS